MIIGIHNLYNDPEMNVLKSKKLINIRATGRDEAVKATTPIIMTLERVLTCIQNDEMTKVTPMTTRHI